MDFYTYTMIHKSVTHILKFVVCVLGHPDILGIPNSTWLETSFVAVTLDMIEIQQCGNYPV